MRSARRSQREICGLLVEGNSFSIKCVESSDVDDRPTVIIIPGPGGGNAYVQLYANALIEHGIRTRYLTGVDECISFGKHVSGSVINVHWPENLWGRPRREETAERWHISLKREARRRLLKWRQMKRFIRWLKQEQRAGRQIWWTLHNVRSHEGHDIVDEMGFRQLKNIATRLLVHSVSAIDEFSVRYGEPAASTLVCHGNYDGVLHTPRDKEVIRNALGIPRDGLVFALVGNVRDYKGLDTIVDAFQQLGNRVSCVIAGKPSGAAAAMIRRARQLDNTIVIDRYLDDQEYRDVVEASDGILLPYRRITTRGALLHAMSCARGVIASDCAYFREILGGEPEAGVLVRSDDVDSLVAGIVEYCSMESSKRGKAARRVADNYCWREVVGDLVTEIRRSHRSIAE